MKKTFIASAILLASLGSNNVNASHIEVTNMTFENTQSDLFVTLSATGTLYEFGGGGFTTTDLFFGYYWNATQETMFMNNTGLWSGTTTPPGAPDNPENLFNYDDEIAAMTENQIAVGLLFDWNRNIMAALAVFDCVGPVEDSIYDDCTGASPMILDNGAFSGSAIGVNAVPVPAALWLMGSGLLALIGISRRKKLN